MPRQKIQVEVATPNWNYCELQNYKNRKCKTGERCRFCKEVKKRGHSPAFVCLLFNVTLDSEGGSVKKTTLCMKNWSKNEILNLDEEPNSSAPQEDTVDIKAIRKAVKSSQKMQKKYAVEFIKQGLPISLAYDLANDQVLKDWNL